MEVTHSELFSSLIRYQIDYKCKTFNCIVPYLLLLNFKFEVHFEWSHSDFPENDRLGWKWPSVTHNNTELTTAKVIK